MAEIILQGKQRGYFFLAAIERGGSQKPSDKREYEPGQVSDNKRRTG
jgi:hypothetical protein